MFDLGINTYFFIIVKDSLIQDSDLRTLQKLLLQYFVFEVSDSTFKLKSAIVFKIKINYSYIYFT